MLSGWIKLIKQSACVLWHVKKDEFTATHKLCNKDINVAHMGYEALKQHSDKKLYIKLSAQLAEACVSKQRGSVKTDHSRNHNCNMQV